MALIYDSSHSGQEIDAAVDAVQTTIPSQLATIGSNLDEIENKITSTPSSFDGLLTVQGVLQLLQRMSKSYFTEIKKQYANLKDLSVGSTFILQTVSFQAYTYECISVEEGDVILLTTNGNTAGAKSYAIIDAEDKVLAIHQGAVANVILVMPVGAKKFVANTSTSTNNYALIHIMGKTADYDSAVERLNQSASEVDNADYIRAIVDSDGRVLCGIKKNGAFVWYIDVPEVVQTFVENLISRLDADITSRLEQKEDISNKVSSISSASTNTQYPGAKLLYDLLLSKVDKQSGKTMIGDDIAESFEYKDNADFVYAITDNNGRVLVSISKNGKLVVDSAELEKINLSSQGLADLFSALGISDFVTAENTNTADTYVQSAINGNVAIYDAVTGTLPDIPADSPSYQIRVASQSDFDKATIQNAINSAIANGEKNISIILGSGVFEFDEKHFDLTASNFPGASGVNLHIIGNGTKMLSAGADYAIDDATEKRGASYSCPDSHTFNPRTAYLDDSYNEIPTHTELKYAQSQIEDLGNDNYRVKVASGDDEIGATKIFITKWFSTGYYDIIQQVEPGYIYFTKVGGISSQDGIMNGDYTYLGQYPRYYLFGSEKTINIKDGVINIPNRFGRVHESHNTCFAWIEGAFNSVEISGVSFIGNANNNSNTFWAESSTSSSLIRVISFTNSLVYLHHCDFKYIKSGIVLAGKSQNVVVADNVFDKCDERLIHAIYTSSYISFINNTITDFGHEIVPYYAVSLSADHVLVKGNVFKNFSAGAISMGAHYTSYATMKVREPGDDRPIYYCRGIIEENIIQQSDELFQTLWKRTLSDTGAIYLAMNDETYVRNNVISNMCGVKDNRGIFCDDGSCGWVIYNNLILDTHNSYDIDFRYVKTSPNHNTNAVILHNVLTGRYKFEDNKEAGNNCYKGQNFVCALNKDNIQQRIVSSIEKEDDYLLFGCRISPFNIHIPSMYMSILKSVNFSNIIKNTII